MITYIGSAQNGVPWALYANKADVADGKPTTKNDGSGDLLPNASSLWIIDAAEDGESFFFLFDADSASWKPQN